MSINFEKKGIVYPTLKQLSVLKTLFDFALTVFQSSIIASSIPFHYYYPPPQEANLTDIQFNKKHAYYYFNFMLFILWCF